MKWLKNDECIDRINSFTKDDWLPLFNLIPEIIKSKEFGRIDEERDFRKTGIFHLEPYIKGEIVRKFLEIVYEIPIIIDFDWSSWDEGRRIVSNETFDFDSIDIPTKCKIITAIVRNDRFCDGVLIDAFESGLMLKILYSIKRQVELEKV
jgi:hypothetical protein